MIFSSEYFQMSEHYEQELRKQENRTKQSKLSSQKRFFILLFFFLMGSICLFEANTGLSRSIFSWSRFHKLISKS